MQIIQFKENQKEIWNKFTAFNNSESFLQSWQWGEFNCALGRKIWRLAIVDDSLSCEDKTKVSSIKYQVSSDNLVAVALIVKYNLPFERSYLYCPRGPVINESRITNHESRISNMLFDEIKKIAKKEKSFFLKIDPPISRWFHSGDSPVEPKCKSCAKGFTLLTELWSRHNYNFKKSPNETQPRNTLMLDLEKSEEELLKEMKQKTRYNIRLAGKRGIKIRNYKLGITDQEEFRKKFDFFWNLTEETSRRDKFTSHNKEYYQKMLESLSDKDQNRRDKQNLYAKLYLAEYKEKIIAANIVLYFGDLAVYLHGSSSSEYRNLMAPYLLQWKQIQDAKTQGYKKYDFWGITIDGEKKNWQGITKFKKGFGGKEKSYIGSYDLVFDNIRYQVYKFIRFVKSKNN